MTRSDVAAWAALVGMALTIASWAKYWVRRNSADEEPARLRAPLLLSGVLVALLVALTVVEP